MRPEIQEQLDRTQDYTQFEDTCVKRGVEAFTTIDNSERFSSHAVSEHVREELLKLMTSHHLTEDTTLPKRLDMRVIQEALVTDVGGTLQEEDSNALRKIVEACRAEQETYKHREWKAEGRSTIPGKNRGEFRRKEKAALADIDATYTEKALTFLAEHGVTEDDVFALQVIRNNRINRDKVRNQLESKMRMLAQDILNGKRARLKE